MTSQEFLHLWGRLPATLLPAQTAASGQTGDDGFCVSSVAESGEAETHFLSRELLWHLRQQRCEEYTVHERTRPHGPSTTLSSTELNLQISVSDLPQPLRSDGF